MPTSLLVITNAEAGGADEVAVNEALDVLRASYDVNVRTTTNLVGLTRALQERLSRDVVVVGGDGSLHAVADVLHRLGELGQPVVGLIPLGTGNDFARALRIPLEAGAAARVIVTGHWCKVDVLVDNAERVVVNAVHAGIGADAGSAARPWKRLGRIAYALGAVLAGLTVQGSRIRVVADGKVLADGRRRLLQVGIGNGPLVGGGVPLLPDADPTDGLADVLVSFATSPMDRLLYGLHLRRGTHDDRTDVIVEHATTVSLSGKAFSCNADGEVFGPITSRTWTVRAAALTVYCPPLE